MTELLIFTTVLPLLVCPLVLCFGVLGWAVVVPVGFWWLLEATQRHWICAPLWVWAVRLPLTEMSWSCETSHRDEVFKRQDRQHRGITCYKSLV